MGATETARATRSYHSELRAARAERTRATVIAAARKCFETGGFTNTTIASIAREAGVSPQTIYGTFGGKQALLRALLEQMEESAEAAHWRERIAGERDPERILAAFAEWTRAFFESSSPSYNFATEAASELADLTAEGDRHRRNALESLIERIAESGALREGLSKQLAVDRVWILTGVQTYMQATVGCGWTPQAYATWLAETLAQQVLQQQPQK